MLIIVMIPFKISGIEKNNFEVRLFYSFCSTQPSSVLESKPEPWGQEFYNFGRGLNAYDYPVYILAARFSGVERKMF